MESERINEPLLYIDQPTLLKPKAYMQNHYKTKKLMEEVETEKTASNNESVDGDKNHSFKSLTVNEKINYLINLPSEVPSIRCEVVTEGKNYRGTIIEDNKEEVQMRIFGRENKTVKKNEIVTVNLIGF